MEICGVIRLCEHNRRHTIHATDNSNELFDRAHESGPEEVRLDDILARSRPV